MIIRYDSVTILNANQQILAGPYCGDTNIPPTYTSTGNQATVKFTSDTVATKSGFDISYTCKGGPVTTTTPTPTPTPTPPADCKPQYLGDGYCDDCHNTVEGNYDGGDCCPPHENPDSWNSFCTTCECLEPTTTTPPPATCNSNYIGDNFCDDACNNKENNYDDGDCCAPHALTNWNQYCQACECRVCRTDSCLCEDNWPKKKCSKKCNAKKCSKSKTCKTNCKESCNLCGVVEPCEDQKSSKYCKKQKKKGKCNKSSVQQKCKKTCDACYTN